MTPDPLFVSLLEKVAGEFGAKKTESGATPKVSDMVKVRYTGTLIDGTVFDSSVKRGEPATFGSSDQMWDGRGPAKERRQQR